MTVPELIRTKHAVRQFTASMWEPEKARAILGVPENLYFAVAISLLGIPKKHTTCND